jgi:sterol desaturase/sphingolipid hydroxylase (fatty acid hydroxylase superfamily)
MDHSNLLILGSWFIASIAAIEGFLAYVQGRRKNSKETLTNFLIYFVRRFFLSFIQKSLQLSALSFFFYLTPFRIENNFISFVCLLFFVDFLYFWKHYAEHKTRLLWSLHNVHHSSSEYNLSTAIRLPWFGAIFLWIFYLPAVLLGFDPLLTLACSQIVLLYQFWIHSEHIPKLGFFENYFNTPSHHRVHHASNSNYLDKNFGGILIIWDKLFGTFAQEEETVKYGLTNPIKSSNPFRIIFDEPIKLIKDMIASQSLKEAIRICYKSPGYKPKTRKKI